MAACEDASSVPLPGGARVNDGDPIVVWMWGEHDLSTVDAMSLALAEAIAAGERDVVVDLAGVTFMDASTIRLLVRGRHAIAARGGHLSLRSPQNSTRRLLAICGLTSLTKAEPGGAADVQGARTALETWIEVPPAGAPAQSPGAASARLVASRDDPEEARR